MSFVCELETCILVIFSTFHTRTSHVNVVVFHIPFVDICCQNNGTLVLNKKKRAKWSIVHLYTAIECDFWTFYSFSTLLAYSKVLGCRCYRRCRCHRCCCCCNFCVSARDIFLYARDSATTFEECINIHIICVCQWTKVLVIIRPLIMTHWLSHTHHKTQHTKTTTTTENTFLFFRIHFATFICN